MQISCAVSVQLICAYVIVYVKSRLSHDAAQFFLKKKLKKKGEILTDNNQLGDPSNVLKIVDIVKFPKQKSSRAGCSK